MSAAAPGAAPGGAPRYRRMRIARFADERGFGQPVEALRMVVPADWRVEGGVEWTGSFCLATLVRARIRVGSPDGRVGLVIHPDTYWEWMEDPTSRQWQAQRVAANGGCPQGAPLDAAGFLRTVVMPGLRVDASAAQLTNAPALARQRLAAVGPELQGMVRAGALFGFEVTGARATVRAGAAEQQLTATVVHSAMPAPDMGAAMRGATAYTRSHGFYGTDVTLAYYPAGERDRWAPLFATMLASVQVNAAWSSAVAQMRRNVHRVELNEVQRQQQMYAAYREWSQDLWARTTAERDAVGARMQDEWGQAIRGVERFVEDSRGERVELSAGYRVAWSNGKGEFLLSDDPGFDPRALTMGEDWRAMARESDRTR